MQPGVQGGHHHRAVQRGGHRDADHVQLAVGDQVLPVAEPLFRGDAVLVAELGQRPVLQAGQADQLDIGQVGVRGHVLLPRPAQTDHARAQRRSEAAPAASTPPVNCGAGSETTPGGA